MTAERFAAIVVLCNECMCDDPMWDAIVRELVATIDAMRDPLETIADERNQGAFEDAAEEGIGSTAARALCQLLDTLAD